MTHPYETFVARREAIQDRVAVNVFERGLRIAERFDDEPYNSDRLNPEQKRAAYALVREDPIFLAERHSHFAKIDKLPEGHLHKGYLDDLAKQEADYQENKSNLSRPIDLTFPELETGPLEAGA